MSDELRVGLTSIEGIVSGPTNERVRVEFLIDSGAQYTLLPHDVWTKLGLRPKRRMRFQMADMTFIERDISECHIELAEGEGHTPVILGEPGDAALLGVITLEELGLVF